MALVTDFSKIAVSSFVNLLIGLITTPLITRVVDPEQYGNWSLFCIYSTVLGSIMLLGTDHIIVRYYYTNKDSAYRTKLARWCCFVCLLSILLISVPVVMVMHHIRPGWSWFILCLFVVNITANVLNRLVNILLRFENEINVLSISTILHKVVFVVVVVVAFFIIEGAHFNILSISTVLSTGATIVLGFYFIRSVFFVKSEWMYPLAKKEMISYGLPLMISGCSYLLFQTTDKLVISYFCTEFDFGIYTSASSFLSLFAILQSSFTTVWWPTVMKNYEHAPENKSMYISANDLICFVLSTVGLTFILLKDVIVLLLGPEYRSAVVVLPFIIFQPILYTLSETTVIGLNFQKKSKLLLYITIASLAFNIIVNITLTKYFGIIGTSIAVGISYIFFFVLRTLVSNHVYKIKFHFTRLFICVGSLFFFALVNSIFPGTRYIYLFASVLYVCFFIMYKDLLKELNIRLLTIIRR